MVMMNGTSTHGGHNTTYSSAVRLGCDHKGWGLAMMCLWKNWSIQLFVLLGFISQIVLAALGSRRKTSSAKTINFFIWSSYSLASYILTLALSKLSTVSLNKSEEEYDAELKALLAPLTLLLLGNPDSITAYSAADNQVGVRNAMNLVITFSFVVWILWRCWKSSIPMTLFFPMFVTGIIKCGETFWALHSVYNENTNMRKEDLDEEKKMLFALMNNDIPNRQIFLKAYYRFNCLKPHLVDWLKYPFFMLQSRWPTDNYSPKDIFLMTEMELGFMYDVLYTKAPVLYTKPGIAIRVIGYFSLLVTFGRFMWLFFDKLLGDSYIIYTFGLLIGVVLLETYQLLKLFYSDWMIIKYPKQLENPIVLKFLTFLVKKSLKKERWSNRIRQFNFLDFCQSDRLSCLFRILRFFGVSDKLRRYLATNSVPIPGYLKQLLVEDIKNFETKRHYRPFTKRGSWTLGIHESLDKLEWSIEMTFDRSIIIWHIATHICYFSRKEYSERKEASKLISDYLMFLLVQHPRILSLTTAEITFDHAYKKFMTFLNHIPKEEHNKENVLKILLGTKLVQRSESQRSDSIEIEITEGWDVLEEAQRLAGELESAEDTWELISSVWVEMLCFAAYNCQQNHHVKLLRHGGDIITHVWLLLSHKTDQFHTMKYTFRNIQIE